MPNSENLTNCQIGENISTMRHLQGLTQQDIADTMTDKTGEHCSAAKVGTWERGTRSIEAIDLYYLAQTLHTSLESLYVYNQAHFKDVDVQRFVAAVKALPPDDMHILQYLLTQWHGNKHVILQLCAMLMSLDARSQSDMMGMAAMLFEQKAEKRAIDIDIEAVRKESDRLLRSR